MLLMGSCSSNDTGEGPRKPTMLTVYVYSPENPVITRADIGPVDAMYRENVVKKLQIWIFESETEAKVGYLNTTETATLNLGTGEVYQLEVSDNFAQRKPAVDVYVFANVTENTCGQSFDEDSTPDDLNDAIINESHFGLASSTTAVPDDGLPMSGILKEQPVIGEAPVLRIGNERNIATAPLTRAVSKLRFIFANTQESGEKTTPELTIKSITIDKEMMPKTEYLIPRTVDRTADDYNKSAVTLWSGSSTAAPIEDPTVYIYDDQSAQAYEDLITTAIGQGELTSHGPYYLRESDKRLTGTITYQIGSNAEKTTAFAMSAAGDFLRNHSWIVYAYHAGGGFLQLETLYLKDWTTKTVSHEVYNW